MKLFIDLIVHEKGQSIMFDPNTLHAGESFNLLIINKSRLEIAFRLSWLLLCLLLMIMNTNKTH